MKFINSLVQNFIFGFLVVVIVAGIVSIAASHEPVEYCNADGQCGSTPDVVRVKEQLGEW